jgi:hypothetical protein
MNYYNNNLDLPFSKKKIYFRELNTREQLLITKANISFSRSIEDCKEYHSYILDIILGCIKNKEDFLKINIIEYILFLLKLRILSIGSDIEFLMNNTKSKTKLTVDLKQYMLNLYNIANKINDDQYTLVQNDLKIKINWPFLNSILNFDMIETKNFDQYQSFEKTLVNYIESISISDKKIYFLNFNDEERFNVFNKIPATLKNDIEKKVLDLVNELTNENLFGLDVLGKYKFNIYNMNFIEHIKIIFSYDLKSLYREIYYLAVNNLSPEFVFGLSDFERKTFLTIIQEENQKSDKSSENTTEYSDAVKKLAVEFNQEIGK